MLNNPSYQELKIIINNIYNLCNKIVKLETENPPSDDHIELAEVIISIIKKGEI